MMNRRGVGCEEISQDQTRLGSVWELLGTQIMVVITAEKCFGFHLVPTVVDWQKAMETQKFLDTVFPCFFQADSASVREAVFYMELQEI